MKKASRIATIVLLFLLGFSALFGAAGMISDPSGESIQLPAEMLDSTPFNNFLIPGVLLGIFNGLLSLVIAVLVIAKVRLNEWMVIFQGCVLVVWLTVELLMGIYYPAMTLLYYAVGTLLIILGLYRLKRQKTQ